MKIYRSNRMKPLADQLVEVLRTPIDTSATPLQRMKQRDMVVVQSQGMARWLDMHIAKQLGICANIDFPFPREVVRQSVCSVVGVEDSAWDGWQPDSLLWPVLESLAEHLDDPCFETLAGYLTGRGGSAARALGSADGILLASEVANVFDRYLSYRPDMVLQWEHQQGGDDWQPKLWRTLRQRMGSDHIAALFSEFQKAIAEGSATPGERLPQRICLFGISTLPPFFLEVFSSLSQIRDVHLFVLCPSNEYWGDIRSKREQARLLRQMEKRGDIADLDALYLDEGNPILASFGRLGRDFQVVLEGMDSASPYVETDIDLFSEPVTAIPTMLNVLQSDVLHLRHRGVEGDAGSAPRLDCSDETAYPKHGEPRVPSIQFHVCHGDLRQVEAIRDTIVRRFALDPHLEPRDIVVMSPDIERFAPLVEAVFGDVDATPRIPFRIADRTMGNENPVAEFLLRMLNVAGGRLTVTDVLGLLSVHPVQGKFGLVEDDIRSFETWVREAGIRWAEDASDRTRHGQPEDGQNTWRFGFDRLLLGSAMRGEGQRKFCGVLPYDEMEGGAAAVLGRVIDACEVLFSQVRLLRLMRSARSWSTVLLEMLDTLLSVDDQELWQMQAVRSVLSDLSEHVDRACCTRDIALDGIQAWLSGRLDQSNRASGFLTGAVTFCALVPMRSIPFKVVILMGMEDGAFPRKGRKTGFDKTHQSPRRGDRNPREEDRYLMLEAILAAEDGLVVTYSGYDPQTGAEQPAAAPIDELMMVVQSSFTVPTDWRVDHPLQPFSPRLFTVGRPLSHDTRMMSAAQKMLRDPSPRPPMFTGPVPEKSPETGVALNELISFFQHPTKAFLYGRMGVYLKTFEDEISDREPLEIVAGLGSWSLLNAAIPLRLQGLEWETINELMAAEGAIPLGASGEFALTAIQEKVDALVARADALREGVPRTVPISLNLDAGRLTGRISDVYPKGRVVVQASKPHGKYTIALWITHLALRAAVTQERWSSYLIPDGDIVQLGMSMSSDEARQHLQDLLSMYHRGQRVPMSFFPKTSWAYFESQYVKNKDIDVAMAAARKTWLGGYTKPEKDAYHEMVFGQEDPLDDGFTLEGVDADHPTFTAMAKAIWLPYKGELT